MADMRKTKRSGAMLPAAVSAGLLSVAVLAIAGCGSSSPSAGSAYGGMSASASPMAGSGSSAMASMPAKTELTVRKTSLGDVLATSSGMTIYWYSKDMKGGMSTCTGSCLTAWPAVTVTGTPTVAAGVKLGGTLGTVKGPDGKLQATYDGYPLYTYAQDMAPGDTTGNGVGGVWHAVDGSLLTSGSMSSGMSGSSSSGMSGGSSSSGMSGGSSSSGMSGSSSAPSMSGSTSGMSGSSGGSGY